MAASKKITCFLDCVSPYSRFGLLHLQRQRAALESHGVEIEFVPMFLGGVNVGSGNKPPWTLPAKAAYGNYDLARAMKYYDTPNIQKADFFPILSLLPQRALCYIKHVYQERIFLTLYDELFIGLWEQKLDISKPELLLEVLSRHLTAAEAKGVLEAAQSATWKEALNQNTARALKLGAFGAPWFLVNNGNGVEEPFFGSDRFHYMWEFLDIPHSDFTVLEAGKSKL